MQTLISLTAMYETARFQGRPAPNAAEFNTYAFSMLLVGRQKDAAMHFFQVTMCNVMLHRKAKLHLLKRLCAASVSPVSPFVVVVHICSSADVSVTSQVNERFAGGTTGLLLV